MRLLSELTAESPPKKGSRAASKAHFSGPSVRQICGNAAILRQQKTSGNRTKPLEACAKLLILLGGAQTAERLL